MDGHATSAEEAPITTVGADAEVVALREENARLRDQIHRIVADLRDHAHADVHVDLDAAPGEAVVRVAPATPTPLGPAGLVEVQQVAERLALVQRDMRRIEQHVERLLWRVGEPAPPLAAVSDEDPLG